MSDAITFSHARPTGRGRVCPARVLLCVALAVWSSAAKAGPTEDMTAARKCFAEGNWAASESLATAAFVRMETEESPDSLAIAGALGQIGWSRWRIAGFADGTALRATTRAHGIFERQLGTLHLEVAGTHYLLAILYRGLDRPDSAEFHARRAVDIRTQAGDADEKIAEALYSLALIQRDRLDYRAAIVSFDKEIEILRRVHGGEDSSMVAPLTASGRCLYYLGDMEGARNLVERALGIARRPGSDHPLLGMVLDNLAYIERSAGNLALAFDLSEEAVRRVQISQGADSRAALTMRGNLGVFLNDIGDFSGAERLLEPLVPLREAQYGRAHPRALHTRLTLAVARAGLGKLAAALRDVDQVESSLIDPGAAADPILSLALRWHGVLLYHDGRYFEAREKCERAIRTEASRLHPNPERLARNQFLLIAALEALGDTAALDSARRELVRIDRAYTLGSSENGPPVPYYAARAAQSLGLRNEALNRAMEAEQLSRERLHLNLRALPDRRALEYVRQQSGYLELVLDLTRDDPLLLESACDRLVRSRGMVRAEMTRRRPPEGAATDTAVAGTHERWIAAQRRLAQALVSLTESDRDSIGRAALDLLRGNADNAEVEYAVAVSASGARVPAADIGWAEVRSKIRPGQALVSFVEFGESLPTLSSGSWNDSILVFVAAGGTDAVRRIDLGSSADLRQVLEAWRRAMATSPGRGARTGDRAERECRRLGRLARDVTWDRIAPYLVTATEVFIVGDGPVLDLPWGALPDGTGGYLVETGPTFHILNAERELAESTPAVDTGSLLALGAPDYDRGVTGEPIGPGPAPGNRRSPDPCAGGDLPVFTPLPGSGAEAIAVARTWQARPGCTATVLTGGEASEQTFKKRARGHAIIHLATHGMVAGDTCAAGRPGQRGVGGVSPLEPPADNPGPPEKTGRISRRIPPSPWLARRVWLAMAGANRARDRQVDENEGLLTAEEILTLDLTGTDWVVLSACHSGLAESWSREGMLGMRRAFDLAGARTVIASQWAVEDDSTREWMEALYAARARGALSPAKAIEAASRAILSDHRRAGRSTHPFYWGAFTPSGE